MNVSTKKKLKLYWKSGLYWWLYGYRIGKYKVHMLKDKAFIPVDFSSQTYVFGWIQTALKMFFFLVIWKDMIPLRAWLHVTWFLGPTWVHHKDFESEVWCEFSAEKCSQWSEPQHSCRGYISFLPHATFPNWNSLRGCCLPYWRYLAMSTQ